MTESKLHQPIIYLTTEELVSVISSAIKSNLHLPQQSVNIESKKQFAYSIVEAANYFSCCPATFQSWKNKGYVKYVQHGRKLIIDLQGTIDLLNKKKK